MKDKQLNLLRESHQHIIDAGQNWSPSSSTVLSPEVAQVIGLLQTADRVITLLRSTDKPRFADGFGKPDSRLVSHHDIQSPIRANGPCLPAGQPDSRGVQGEQGWPTAEASNGARTEKHGS